MSRKIEDLVPEAQEKYHAFDAKMDEAGIDYIVTCTRRTQAEQDALYAQGRTKPGPIVTWTRNSRHISGKAFDICIMENGKCSWDTDNPKWEIAGQMGKSIGLIWGGDWKHPDYPHFEVA